MNSFTNLFTAKPTEARPKREAPAATGTDAFIKFAHGELNAEQAVRVAYFEKAHQGSNLPSSEERHREYENGKKRHGRGGG